MCVAHGGAAPQVKRKAGERLLELVDSALVELDRILRSRSADNADKIRAANSVLDRVRETARVGKREVSGPGGGPVEVGMTTDRACALLAPVLGVQPAEVLNELARRRREHVEAERTD